jgi:hypothetical protein
MKTRLFWPSAVLLLLCVSAVAGCSSPIARFDQAAYEKATSLKVDSLALMGKATEPYAQHEIEIAALMLQVEKAYEYAKGKPKNEITAKQWEILKDPNRNLLGGFMQRWEENQQLSTPYVKEAKGIVSDAYDTIIGLEGGKIRPPNVK